MKLAVVSPYLSILTLKVNGLNFPIKRYRVVNHPKLKMHFILPTYRTWQLSKRAHFTVISCYPHDENYGCCHCPAYKRRSYHISLAWVRSKLKIQRRVSIEMYIICAQQKTSRQTITSQEPSMYATHTRLNLICKAIYRHTWSNGNTNRAGVAILPPNKTDFKPKKEARKKGIM
jgi:hypothetical protein